MAIRGEAASLLERLDRLPFSRWHRALLLVAFFGIVFDAADFAIFGAALPTISREFGLTPAQAGLLATLGLIGAFLGALFWGSISDYIGRRTSFQATIAIFAAFTGLVAASWSVASLGFFRFVSNFGLGGEVPVSATLVAEFMPSRLRGRATVNMAAGFPLGLVVAALLGILIVPHYGWRTLYAIGIIPAMLLLFVRRHVPESVRYLLSKGQVAAARRTVEHIEESALAGRRPAPAAPAAAASTAALGAGAPRVTVLMLLTPDRLRRTILLWIVSACYLWASNGILFMLPTILTQRGLPLSQAIGVTLVQAIFGFFGYSACGFLIDWLGRRPVLFLYFFVGAAFHLWFALASSFWMWPAIALVGWVNPGVFGGCSVYAAELYPTEMRATAVGWFFGIGRIGSFLAPAVIGFMLSYGLGAYVLHTFALAYLIAAAALLGIGIETKGLLLEKITGDEPAAETGLAPGRA
ncbi:MAG TPA: MFS transporter [Stellaceae bacterium]